MKQVPRTLRPDTKYLEKWEKTVDMVHWESNSLIKRHPHIDPDKIIARNATHEFPADAITVRFRNQRLKDVGVYFYGKVENAHHGVTAPMLPHLTITLIKNSEVDFTFH